MKQWQRCPASRKGIYTFTPPTITREFKYRYPSSGVGCSVSNLAPRPPTLVPFCLSVFLLLFLLRRRLSRTSSTNPSLLSLVASFLPPDQTESWRISARVTTPLASLSPLPPLSRSCDLSAPPSSVQIPLVN